MAVNRLVVGSQHLPVPARPTYAYRLIWPGRLFGHPPPDHGMSGGTSDHRETSRVAKLKIRRNPTRRYEAVYIFESALEDVTIAEKLEKFHALLETTDPIELEHWGRRALAYKIGRHENGYYVIAHYTIDPKVLPEYERAMKLDGTVIRYLITLYEHELGAPKLSDEELASRRRLNDDDDDDEE